MFIRDYMFFETYRLNNDLKKFGIFLNDDFFKNDKNITVIRGVTEKKYTKKNKLINVENNRLDYKLNFIYSNKFKKHDMNKIRFETALKYDNKTEMLEIPECLENNLFKNKIERLSRKLSLLKFVFKKDFLDDLLKNFIKIEYKISFSYKKKSKFLPFYEIKKDDIQEYVKLSISPSVLSLKEPFYSGFDDLIKYNSNYKIDLNKNEDIFNKITDRINEKYEMELSLDDNFEDIKYLLNILYIE